MSHPVFPVLLLPSGERGSERGGTHRRHPRESDAEDDAGAAKLDTSPAVLSPSFILRTFLPATSLDALPSRLRHSPRFLALRAFLVLQSGRVDGVSRATSRMFFKIAPPRERAAFCGSHRGRAPLVASTGDRGGFLFSREIFRSRITSQSADLRFPRRGDTLIDLSVSAANSKTNVSSPSFSRRDTRDMVLTSVGIFAM